MAADLPGLATGADAEPARLALRDLTPTASAQHSPHAFVEQIRTPMLVVHGDRDYRVPIGEGLRLWWELLSRSELALDADGRTASCTSPTRTIGCSARNMQRSGTARYRRSWRNVLGEAREYPELLG